jgi:hypothetical protein
LCRSEEVVRLAESQADGQEEDRDVVVVPERLEVLALLNCDLPELEESHGDKHQDSVDEHEDHPYDIAINLTASEASDAGRSEKDQDERRQVHAQNDRKGVLEG